MRRATYLRFISFFLLISFLLGVVAMTILLFRINSFDGYLRFPFILAYIVYLIFGPAMFILFRTVADLAEGKDTNDEYGIDIDENTKNGYLRFPIRVKVINDVLPANKYVNIIKIENQTATCVTEYKNQFIEFTCGVEALKK